jgi:hypothetical protein
MAIIRIYKYLIDVDGTTEVIYRYSVPNLESLNVQYNTPISPMPLPEEDADENILVKIEGNSASIDIDWTLANYEYTTGNSHFQQWRSDNDDGETLKPVTDDARGKFNPVGETGYPITFTDMDEPTGNPARQIYMFREFFESKSLENDYLITIEDDAAGYGAPSKPTKWYGSISQMSFAISGSSPIVWRARIQFFVGNVITVFDSDSPESPQSLSAVHKTGTVDGNAWGIRDVIKVRFKDPSSFGATDVNSAIISYKLDGKLQWANVKYDIATATTDGEEDTLTKISGGVDDEFYVVYLPPKAEGVNGADNYGGATNGAADSLTSTGLFDTSTYVGASYTLTADKIYDVKVHFGNTSGEGGLSEVSVKTS